MSSQEISKSGGQDTAKRVFYSFRSFKIISLFAIVIILIVASLGLRDIFRDMVIYEAEKDAIRVGRALRNTEIQRFIETNDEDRQTLAVSPEDIPQLDLHMRTYLEPFDIVKIKVFDTETRIIYCTDPTLIGKLDIDNSKLASALSGKPVSKYETKEHVYDLAEEIRGDVGIVETYIPVYAPNGKIVGSFEIYKDVTPDLALADRTLARAGAILAVTVLVVFAALMFAIHRAGRTINSGTAALMVANNQLEQEIGVRKKTEIDLKDTHDELMEASHKAGMAEVATDVLHNVGNVVNSVNILTSLITEKFAESKISNLRKVAEMVEEHLDDLGTFLTEDPKGKHIPSYFVKATRILSDDQEEITEKLQSLGQNVDHIKEIVSMQQSYARTSGVEVAVVLEDVMENAIQINSAGLERHGIDLVRKFDELPEVNIDKQKVLQILVNLISNAKYALSHSEKSEKRMTIRVCKYGDDGLRIEVADNGLGISKDDLTKIFRHGFTTKKDGHGFGLHSGALAAKEMGGSLNVHSDGPGCGAKFTLELPFKPVKVCQ